MLSTPCSLDYTAVISVGHKSKQRMFSVVTIEDVEDEFNQLSSVSATAAQLKSRWQLIRSSHNTSSGSSNMCSISTNNSGLSGNNTK